MKLWELVIVWVVVGAVNLALAAGLIAGGIWLVVTILRSMEVL